MPLYQTKQSLVNNKNKTKFEKEERIIMKREREKER